MGEPLSPYLVKKLNLNYDTTVTTLNDAIKAGDKKKSAFSSKSGTNRYQALKSLLFYNPSTEVSHSVLPLISHSDKITQRLAYYHLNWSQELLKDPNSFVRTIQAELNEKNIGRRLLCLRTFSHLVPHDSHAANELIKYAESILEPQQASNKKGKVTKDNNNRQILQYAALLALRQLNVPDIPKNWFPFLTNVLETSEFPIAIRHAISLLQRYAKDSRFSGMASSELRKFMPNAPPAQATTKTLLSEDMMARLYLVQTFAIFTDFDKLPEDARTHCDEYYEALGHFVADINVRVSFEAMNSISLFGWKKLSVATITVREGIDYLISIEETSILKRILDRLVHEITTHSVTTRKSQCILHAALRSVITIGHTYVSSDAAKSDDVNPLTPLFSPLQTLLSSCQDIIRVKTLISLIWIVQPYNSDFLIPILDKEIQLDRISPEMYNNILRAFHDRIIASPNMAAIALHFIFIIATRRPKKAAYKPIAQLWTNIIKVSPNGKQMVQEHIFKILDHPPCEDTHDSMTDIHRLAYYVLAREAIHLSRKNGSKASLDIPCLRSIILRLEYSILSCVWEIRNASIDGLTKIAFLAPALRVHIMSFFQANELSTWNPFVDSIMETLQQIINSQEKWNNIAQQGKLSDSQAKELEAENQALLEQASRFCTLPDRKLVSV